MKGRREGALRTVDLHLHTNHSDGSDSPGRVVERAAELDFAAIAITDHDTVSGLEEAQAWASKLGLELLPGTEISASHRGQEVHILGLGVDPEHAPFLKRLSKQVEQRVTRAREIVDRLLELGVPVNLERLFDRAEGAAIGRMHIAREVVEVGCATTVQDAFDKYIKRGRPAFVARPAMSCKEAIDTIHEAGGLAFVAHPGIGNLQRKLKGLLGQPFDGIEVFHTHHAPEQSETFAELARERGLLITGGSDCHGTVKGQAPEMGKVRMAWEHYARIREAL